MAVASLSLATSERYKDKAGEWQEKTEWHKVVVWKGLAEACGQNLHKGSQIHVEGKLQTKTWEDRDGSKRSAVEILAGSIQFLDGKKKKDENGGHPPGDEQAPVYDDDIPF